MASSEHGARTGVAHIDHFPHFLDDMRSRLPDPAKGYAIETTLSMIEGSSPRPWIDVVRREGGRVEERHIDQLLAKTNLIDKLLSVIDDQVGRDNAHLVVDTAARILDEFVEILEPLIRQLAEDPEATPAARLACTEVMARTRSLLARIDIAHERIVYGRGLLI